MGDEQEGLARRAVSVQPLHFPFLPFAHPIEQRRADAVFHYASHLRVEDGSLERLDVERIARMNRTTVGNAFSISVELVAHSEMPNAATVVDGVAAITHRDSMQIDFTPAEHAGERDPRFPGVRNKRGERSVRSERMLETVVAL